MKREEWYIKGKCVGKSTQQHRIFKALPGQEKQNSTFRSMVFLLYNFNEGPLLETSNSAYNVSGLCAFDCTINTGISSRYSE